MFTDEGRAEYEKWRKWIEDENYDLSPNFVPTEDTPQGAIDYYKEMESMLINFDDPNFTWPTGCGMNL
ncbi:MAG: hypothetical protein ACLU06_04500 [Eggerthellaceae bacterium]